MKKNEPTRIVVDSAVLHARLAKYVKDYNEKNPFSKINMQQYIMQLLDKNLPKG